MIGLEFPLTGIGGWVVDGVACATTVVDVEVVGVGVIVGVEVEPAEEIVVEVGVGVTTLVVCVEVVVVAGDSQAVWIWATVGRLFDAFLRYDPPVSTDVQFCLVQPVGSELGVQ